MAKRDLLRERLLAVLLVLSAAAALNGAQAVFPGAKWEASSPEAQGVDSAILREAVEGLDSGFGPEGAQQLVIVRHGRLIWRGPGSGAYHNVWSCTKTFTSAVLGLLAAEGKCSIDDFAVRHLPALDNLHPSYGRIRLRHLASMSAGYRGEVAGVTKEQPWGEPVFYLNPAAPRFEPGANVQYNDHEVFLLGGILTRLAGEPLKSYFRRRIAEPIGMTRWDWGVSGSWSGLELNNAAGTPTNPGIQTTPIDMARFGLLYLNRGHWNGRQLLPASFVDEAVRNQVAAAGASRFLHGRYGFYWWTNDIRPDGRRPWPSAPPRAYTSHGNGSNFCFVIPEWDMVVVRLGTIPLGSATSVPSRQEIVWDAFLARLGQALDRGRKEP